ncbi:MAG TPA: hypothetical protein VF531_08640 [Bacillota bacterium]
MGDIEDRSPVEALQEFVDRKRPALEGLVEDQLGLTTQLDEFLSTHLPPESRIAPEEEQDEDNFQPT